MNIPLDKIIGTLKVLPTAKKDVDEPVRVAVFVDGSASADLIAAVRDAFVPQTTSALVRVERLGAEPVSLKADTDLSLVLTGGSEQLQGAVQEIVIGGAPTVIVTDDAAAVSFIREETPVLGYVAEPDRSRLQVELAHAIISRVEKRLAFAANFPFLRVAAASEVIRSAALGNALTGALVFIPGADFPVMTAAQLGMMAQLALVFGKPIRPERAWEAAGVVASAFLVRALARQLVRRAGPAGFAVKALVGGAGTWAMGWVLTQVYQSDIDYAPVNRAAARLIGLGRSALSTLTGGRADAQAAA